MQQHRPFDVFFPSGDGEILHGWLLRAKQPIGTILVFHGNAQNLTTHVNNLEWLVQENINVFIVDYGGYGISTGKPTLDGVHRDGLAAVETLMTLQNIDPKRMAVLGQSLGGAVAVYVLAMSPHADKLKLLVLDSVFSSYRDMARRKLANFFFTWPLQYPLSLLYSDYYSPASWAEQVKTPVVMIRDKNDIVVLVASGDKLYAAIRTEKELWSTDMGGTLPRLLIRKFATGWLNG